MSFLPDSVSLRRLPGSWAVDEPAAETLCEGTGGRDIASKDKVEMSQIPPSVGFYRQK